MQVNIITVELTKDSMTRIVADIPAHEVEVQQLVFGRDNVNVINDAVGSVELNVDDEPDRLVRKYGETAVSDTFGPNYHGKVIAAMEANAAVAKSGKAAKSE